ncbi:MAG: MFS transporter [Chloroflexota bacterium]|nr:MFS transporter [Chloroflexota bacterium]
MSRETVRPGPVVVLLLSWFVAFNLRSGFVGLGPALPDLTLDLGLTFVQSSLLVSAPTLLMGLLAVPGGLLADRWGAVRAIALGTALVAIGGGARALTLNFGLMAAITILFGAGIGLAQPSLPRLMRTRFPQRLGVTTGVYASGLVCGAIVGAVLSAFLLEQGGDAHAWRIPIATWGILAAFSAVIWCLVMRPWQAPDDLLPQAQTGHEVAVDWSPWRDRRAWIAAFVFAAQGMAYYLLIAWLPAVYAEDGGSAAVTAALAGVFNAATLPGILLFPIWSDRLQQRKLPAITASVLFTIGVAGLTLAPLADPLRWVWPALAGAGVAGVFGMALVMPADLAPAGRTGRAAGMVLAVGYAGSALGPIAAGLARDLTGSFDASLILLPIVGIAMTIATFATPEMPGRARSADRAGRQAP